MQSQCKDKLAEIVGPGNFSDGIIDLVSYSCDASEHSTRPQAVVWPTNAEQVREVILLANELGFPLFPRGAGTGLSGMAVPRSDGVVMDLARMRRIIDICIEDRVAVVEPGVVYADLEKALAPHGYFYPPDPASGKVCTLGGNVATNAGGVKGAKYGTTKDYVLGLSLVLGDGREMRVGGRNIKSASGYDLTHLFVGSEGTLGVFTEIILKVNPKPTATATALAVFDNLEDAGAAIIGVMSSGIVPSVLEILGRETLEAINQNTDLNLPEVDAMLLCETDGFTQAEADYQMARVVQQFQKNQAHQVRQATEGEEVVELWKARKSAYAVLARLKPNFVLEDITVPISRVVQMFKGVQEIAQRHQVSIATFGHAGDGNLHPQVLWDAAQPGETERVEQAVDELFALAIKLGGTLTGEHGIGLSKAAYMGLEHGSASMDLMRVLKRSCDPNNILNPGKMALEG